MTLLYFILLASIMLNFIFFRWHFYPFIKKIVKEKLFKIQYNKMTSISLLEKKVLKKSIELSDLNKITAFWESENRITETFVRTIYSKEGKEFKQFNYPKAFLFYGLTSYLKIGDLNSLTIVKKKFDEFIDKNGNPYFVFDKVDQVPFGLASLNLYEIYKEERYMKFADYIYSYLSNMSTEERVILYRKESKNQFNDLIGMVVPFLVKYYNFNKSAQILEFARTQLDFYNKYGLDKDTCIPSHGFNLQSKIKTGSINWGRGIGWYLLGLAYLNKETREYDDFVDRIYDSLIKTKTKNNLYTQFPGSSTIIDSSTSTIFIYSFIILNKEQYTKEQIMNLFGSHIDKDGMLLNTSGDTFGLNRYSSTFNESELSQGMLLLLLSQSK